MPEPSPRPLAEAKRAAAADHVLAATRRLVIGSGLDVTMDALAEVSGVSRRTLFRMFGTREALIAAAFDAGMAGYGRKLPEFDGDLNGWLRATCAEAHRMNSVIGPGFFELASRTDLPPDLARSERRRRSDFRAMAVRTAETAWRAAGRDGAPPPELIDTVGAHLSPHFTAAATVEGGRDWRTAAELAYAAILAALQRLQRDTLT